MTIPPISPKTPSTLPCTGCRSRPLSVFSTIAFMFRFGAIYGGAAGANTYWDRTNPKQRNFKNLSEEAFSGAIIGGLFIALIPFSVMQVIVPYAKARWKDLEKASKEDTDTPPK